MRPHPIRLTAPSAPRRAILALAAFAACALPAAASAQASGDQWLAHRMAGADAAVLGSLAGLRVAQLADTSDVASGHDNAHCTLTEDEALADADLRMAVAVVQFVLPTSTRAVAPLAWIDGGSAARLALSLPAVTGDWAQLTVRLATQPGLELDVGVLGAMPIVVRDARLHGAGGSANFSAQTNAVELEWRQGLSIGWTSVLIGVQPHGVATRLIASIAL